MPKKAGSTDEMLYYTERLQTLDYEKYITRWPRTSTANFYHRHGSWLIAQYNGIDILTGLKADDSRETK